MDFLRKIADSSPLPAGGAAVAYTLALAIGLLNKIILLEIHRRADQPELEKDLLAAKGEVERLLREVEPLVEQDVVAFTRFSRSRRKGDQGQIRTDFGSLIEISMKILQSSETALEWVRRLRRIVPTWMVVNLMVAAELVMGAVNACVHLVRANLRSLKSAQMRGEYLKSVTGLQRDCREKHAAVLAELLQERQ